MKMYSNRLPLACAAALSLCSSWVMANDPLVVYSARNEHLIKPLFDAYSKKTGVQIQYVTDKEGPLMSRLKAEGVRSPADILLTVDAGNLWQASEMNLLRPIRSVSLTQNVPSYLRDPQGRWYGLSVRARTLVYNTRKVKANQLSTYENLASPAWKGRLCLRSSKNVYNQSLVAMFIANYGAKPTEQIVRGWVSNLAAAPFANDTAAIQAVAAGQCDVTIVNSYYYGRFKTMQPSSAVAIFWPNQNAKLKNRGVHINITGAGVTRASKQPAQAQKLIEWMASPEAQNLYADLNFEYPVNPKVKADEMVRSWGNYFPNRINVAAAGRLQPQAVMLMDRVGYQ